MEERTQSKKAVHKGVYILPNLFTVGSIFAAFLGLIQAHQGNFHLCAIAILISALLDGMDGKIARLTGSSSDFGVQMDSLADAIAFGLTPAFMVYLWQLHNFNRLGIAIAFFFATCGVLRLARFNLMASAPSSKKFFTGLPIPAAGCALACLVLFNHYMPDKLLTLMPGFTLVLTFLLGLLMVSRVRYFAFKDFSGLKARPFTLMVVSLFLFVLIIINPRVMGFLYFLAYLLSGPIYTLCFFKRKPLPKAASSTVEAKTQDEKKPDDQEPNSEK